ncbi:MFS-type transporter SLC18B1 [Holothuria leucospilota]|uniref:MFS-type transporter SLC18B1 n=1 Tax=Holothuria leucospilota TaxID=206669 RepID=A0A9Q0YK72_HOLLE|nr:MFS-type transporter SLC18B1 [Holothuria leucospilota]
MTAASSATGGKTMVYNTILDMEGESDDEETKDEISFIQICTFVCLALALIMDNASYYMKEPFFPVVAKEVGVSEAEIGIIFGVHFLVALLCSPIVGKFIPVFGTKCVFLTGLGIGAATDVMFTLVKDSPSRTSFFVAALSTECIAAVGSAAIDTAALAIVAQVFPTNVGKMVGMVETFSGVACLIGQPMGGFLYEFGGYELPFLTFAFITAVCLVINFLLLPSSKNNETTTGSIWEMIGMVDIYPICIFVFIVSFSDGFLQPILALKAQEFDLTAGYVGGMFLLQGAVYTLFASMCGCVADVNGSIFNKPMALAGVFIITVSFLVMGPSPIFPVQTKQYQMFGLYIGLSFMGLGLAMTYVPSYPELISVATDHGMLNDLRTQGIAAGLTMAVYCCGSFLGPIAGSLAYQYFGFAISTSAVSILFLFCSVLVSTFYLFRTLCKT